jgi:hypothetical protein
MIQQTHLEFYLSWFRHEAEIHDRKLILKFNRPSDIVLVQPEPPDKKHKRKHSSSSKEPKSKTLKSENIKRRGSGQVPHRLHSGEYKLPVHSEFVKKNDWDLLEITFTNHGGQSMFLFDLLSAC